MILIGISGHKGVGKDLLASFLRKKYGFLNFPFAEELKEGVRRDFNLTLEHTDGRLKEMPVYGATPREIMIQYGQFFRRWDLNWWVRKTFDKIEQIRRLQTTSGREDNIRISISDVRFRNEADFIKQQGGILIRLNRPQELNIYGAASNDPSETELDDYNGFDIELPAEENLVPEDLSKFADVIIKYIQVTF